MAPSSMPLPVGEPPRPVNLPSQCRSNKKGQLGKYHVCQPDKPTQQQCISYSRQLAQMCDTPLMCVKALPGVAPCEPLDVGGRACTPASTPLSCSRGCSAKYYGSKRCESVMRADGDGDPKKFSLADWHKNNVAQYTLSCTDRQIAAQCREGSWGLVKEGERRTKHKELETEKKLGERMKEIRGWKDELNEEISLMSCEIQALLDCKRCVCHAVEALCRPVQIAEECLLQRERRRLPDRTSDDAETCLVAELNKVKSYQEQLREHIDSINEQIQLNRRSRAACENDFSNKCRAHLIDSRCYSLTSKSTGLRLYTPAANHHSSVTDTDTWNCHSWMTVRHSRRDRASSERIRSSAEQLISESISESFSAFNKTNSAFLTRIRDTKDALKLLQHQLSRTDCDITDTESDIRALRCSVCDKEAPLKLVSTRLEQRSHKPPSELCDDQVTRGLRDEMKELCCTIARLKEKLCLTQYALKKLHTTKYSLQHQICVKETTLDIDEKMCMGMRAHFPVSSLCSALTRSMPVIC